MADDVALESQDFEALLKDLTALVDRLERGNLPLEESIATYEKGATLLARAQQVLDAAQARLEKLIGPDQVATVDPAQFLEGK